MNRKDGLSKVFKMFIGDVVYKLKRESTDNVIVRTIYYKNNDHDFSETVLNFKGQTHYSIMIKKLCEFNFRSEFIIKVLSDLMKENSEQQIIVLAHNKNFPGDFYSTLAGFIEPGESAESAIEREVFEEVSVRVKNITYYGSQSWPFPSQLMLGYHAEYESGEVQPDGVEIDKADWFNYQELPQVPTGNISISGQLIESFVDKLKN